MTLLEVIVVMTIILVLASLLFPVFTRSKGRAQETVCISNVKQILGGIELYANDNDGKYPWVLPSHPALLRYIGATRLRCPVSVSTNGGFADYVNYSARYPAMSDLPLPDPTYPKEYDDCRVKRGSDFPFVIDNNYVSRLQVANAGRSVLIIGRANGSVTALPSPMSRLNQSSTPLPCAPSLFTLNL